jgi:hypothetical protein
VKSKREAIARLTNLDNLSLAVIYQTMIMPLAGIAQIMSISILAKNFNIFELGEAMRILNYSTFFIFLDFGILFNAFYYASKSFSMRNIFMSEIIHSVLKYSCWVVAVNLVFAIIVWRYINQNMGIYLFLNSLTIPGLASMALIRGFGNDLKYLLIFNASWPISLITIVLVQYFSIRKYFGIFIAFVPICSSIITGIVALVIVWLKARTSRLNPTAGNLSGYRPSWNQLIQFRVASTLLISALCLQLDKFLVSYFSGQEKNHAGEYLYLGLIATSGISFLASLGTSALREEISVKELNNKRKLVLPRVSLLISLISYSVITVNPRDFFAGVVTDSQLTLLVCLVIFLYGPLLHYQTILNSKRLLLNRLIGSLVQILIISSFVLLPNSYRNPIVLATLHCLGVSINTLICRYFLQE